jgi:hypothetical protein
MMIIIKYFQQIIRFLCGDWIFRVSYNFEIEND